MKIGRREITAAGLAAISLTGKTAGAQTGDHLTVLVEEVVGLIAFCKGTEGTKSRARDDKTALVLQSLWHKKLVLGDMKFRSPFFNQYSVLDVLARSEEHTLNSSHVVTSRMPSSA